MALNQLHHGKTLTSLFIEAKWAKNERRWSRFGRNGETSTGAWARDARKAYNKAARKASRRQLSRYQAPVEQLEMPEWDDEIGFFDWCDLITEADKWYEEKRFNEQYCTAQDYQDYMSEAYATGLN